MNERSTETIAFLPDDRMSSYRSFFNRLLSA